jgi:dipeptidyl aminopeptidase/acylaminoacyl peptidase
MSVLTRPFGSWPSPIGADRIATASLRLGQPRIVGGEVWWLEGRPAEGGRQVVVSAPARGGAPTERSPADVNVRTRVHEYGGGDYGVGRGRLFYVDFEDQRLHGVADGRVAPISRPGARQAEPTPTPDGRWLLAVEEEHGGGGEPENRIVAHRLPASGLPARPAEALRVASGHDFYSSPVVSPRGDAIAYVAWDHPQMPWDGTVLYVQGWSAEGPRGTARVVAGGPGESVVQPRFSPAGSLTFVSDRSGWWNLHQLRGDTVVPLCPRDAEFAGPQWVFGLSRYAFLGDDDIVCAYGVGGATRLARLDVTSGRLSDLDLPYCAFEGVRAEEGMVCFVGGRTDGPAEVVAFDVASHRTMVLRRGSTLEVEADVLVAPEAIELPSVGGREVHAYVYAPARSDVRAPAGERPPLLVKSHGGPTSAATPALDWRIQYWVSRGVAVVDVDYGGSTGYGRAYRDRLRGAWGVVDVEDCVEAARHLADAGRADAARLTISGGSAGGYTTLCALTFHDAFAAGASHYGIGDLEALVRDTHKFEARYMDGLVGPYPEARDVYVARSPIHFPDRLSCPVIFFQGLEDRVVPPNQAEAMVAALAARGIPHAYVPFAGEQHGFRRAENIRAALEGELYFYGRIFGFETDAAPGPVRIVG